MARELNDRETEMVEKALGVLRAAGLEVSHGWCRNCHERHYVVIDAKEKFGLCQPCHNRAAAEEVKKQQRELHSKFLLGAKVSGFGLDVKPDGSKSAQLYSLTLELTDSTQWILKFGIAGGFLLRPTEQEIKVHGYGVPS